MSSSPVVTPFIGTDVHATMPMAQLLGALEIAKAEEWRALVQKQKVRGVCFGVCLCCVVCAAVCVCAAWCVLW